MDTKRKSHLPDHRILDYTHKCLAASRTQKHAYLDNDCTKLDEHGVDGKGITRKMSYPKSEGNGQETREIRPHDLEGVSSHKKRNIFGTTGKI